MAKSKYASHCRKLGEKILKQSWAKGWSGRRLAAEFPDQSVSTVNRWTNDEDSALAQAGRCLLQLADTFGCSVDYLIRDEVEDPTGGLLSPQQRYLLALAERIGVDESIDRLLGIASPMVPEGAPPVAATTRARPPRSARG